MTATLSVPPRIPADSAAWPWIRTSERLALTQCEQKWEWAYVDRIKPATPKPALRFGTLIHSALEAYYLPGLKRGPHPALTFAKLYEQGLKREAKMGFRDEDGTWHEAGELGKAMLEAYIDKYGKDRRWKVLHTEYPFHMPVRTAVQTSRKLIRVKFVYVGVLDGIWLDRETGLIWIVDHKTTKDDPTKKQDILQMDEQAGAYWTFGVDAMIRNGVLPKGVKLEGMMYNFLRKGMPDERKTNELGQALNQDGTVSKRQPTPLFARPEVFRGQIDGEAVRRRVAWQAIRMRRMRAGIDIVTKVPGTLHNPHCKWCDFKDMCELHETGADWEAFRNGMMTKWEPYSQHEIQEGR